jgi:hypothetical protein
MIPKKEESGNGATLVATFDDQAGVIDTLPSL